MSNLFNNPDNLVDVVRQILSGKPLEEKKKEEELDPVNKQAVKKKFDDRKDKDIDNDGDVDSSDKFLHKRRKAISKALNEKEPKKKINASHCEEVELDENYRKAALKGIGAETANSIKVGTGVDYYSPKDGSKHMGKITRMDKNGYEVKDEKTGKTFKFKYYSKDAMKEETFNEEKDDDGEEKTAAQKNDPDGDGKADGDGKKKPVKKKKKKEEGDNEKDTAEIGSNKPDVIDTKPSIETSSMVSEAEGSVKVKAGPAHDKKVKSITGLAKKMGLKVTRQGKSDDGKMTTIHLSGNQKKILDMQALQSRLDEDKYNKDAVNKEIKRDPRIKGKEAKMIHRLLKGRTAKKEETDLDEDKQELGKISKELEGASKMHKGQSDRIKAMLKKKDDTMKENRDDGETNLVVQLRKAISLRGNKVRFADGKSVVISDKDAQKFMGMFSKLKKPAEKEMLMKSAAKSHKHFKMALTGKVENPKSSGLDLPKMKSEK